MIARRILMRTKILMQQLMTMEILSNTLVLNARKASLRLEMSTNIFPTLTEKPKMNTSN